MPVIQLRTPADYFGINEAPQQPLFQASQNVDPDIAFHRQMVGLRQQRPLAQAQAIQNQYSTIFNNAEKLRLEQQAAREAEQAVSSLVGIKPESDTYLQQKADIQRQFPLASLDPRVQRIFQDNDDIYRSRQSAIAKQQEDMMKRREELQVMGVPPDMAEKAAQSRDATAQLKFQYGKGSAKDITSQAMKEDFELLDASIKDMIDEGTNEIQNEDGTFSPSPEFQRLTEERKRLRDELRGFYQGKYRPAATASATKEVEKPVATPTMTPEPKEQKASIGGLPPEVIARLQNVPANELDAAIKKEEEALKAVNEVNAAWTRAKQGLEEKLKTVLPDKPNRLGINPLELFAQQVLQGVQAQGRSQRPQLLMGAGSANVAPNLVPVWQNVLEDIGVNPTQKVFTEPGKGRLKLFETLGTQDVNYSELVKDWAKRFLDQRGKLLPTSESPTGSQPTPEQATSFEKVRAKIEGKTP